MALAHNLNIAESFSDKEFQGHRLWIHDLSWRGFRLKRWHMGRSSHDGIRSLFIEAIHALDQGIEPSILRIDGIEDSRPGFGVVLDDGNRLPQSRNGFHLGCGSPLRRLLATIKARSQVVEAGSKDLALKEEKDVSREDDDEH
jgi:hypothetical protein